MHINVIVRDASSHIQEVFRERQDEPWAGVDHGVVLLLKAGIVPAYNYGDFDSITEEERKFIKEHIDIDPVPSEKDDTDLALCLADLAAKGYESINVYGATGGRMDHALGNIQLLMHEELRGTEIKIIDRQNVISLIQEGKHEVRRQEGMKYISFLPFNEKTTLSLDGFLYDLDEQLLEFGTTLTISNEFTKNIGNVYTDKDILMIQSKD
ncbi:thiamine diphosphokinase [Salinicoccus halodurans]|uniref:Thiamine diphosphokinase n=1 Tax=Salinicoccus halodurans TaxID=407035 RepID=A0A0F7HLK9_9STAP|nr:thiamine diphosphokinase [Salinicoccus halodurans]AKG73744.1 thiamine pyrophosphokinase [Salinicoccus halodurans]SFK55196.1 thiamine diphosphokinase [Salinicoccus halodurans]